MSSVLTIMAQYTKEKEKKRLGDHAVRGQCGLPRIHISWGRGRGKNSGEPGPYNISIHDSIRHLLENIEYKRFEAIV